VSRSTYTVLGPQDRQAVQAFLEQDPLSNLYLIHGLRLEAEQSSAAPTFWGAWQQGQLIAVLYVDRESRPPIGHLAACQSSALGEREALAYLGALAVDRAGARVLNGPKTDIEPALARLAGRTRVKRAHFYQVTALDGNGSTDGVPGAPLARYSEYPVYTATCDDIPGLVELYRGYEFRRQNRTDDEIRTEIEWTMAHSGTYFCVRDPDAQPGQIVSAACIYPETDRAGMIGAARTLPAYRGRRIYLSVRTTAFEHVVGQGKTGLGVFLDTNTSMHRVLERQGGTVLGEWWITHVQPKYSLVERIRRSRLWKLLRARQAESRSSR
jgi:hypothetical protein